MKVSALAISLMLAFGSASSASADAPAPAGARAKPFTWENATVYFLLTDRFDNADPANDHAYGRMADAAVGRGFMGGDLAGVTAKVKAGYFTDLGVDAIWITPPVEQIHGYTDEGTGKTYAFHGYWARDFTAMDANLGSERDLHDLVDAAHARGIRVLLDVVVNHTGPVTAQDPVWPADWVRTGPTCTFKDMRTTTSCTLVKNLPDIRTDSDASVALPPMLVAKWKKEGRYEREVKELDDFFNRTGYPRAPRYYLMKWHADWVRKYGIDGFRCDTVKHTEPGVWKDLKTVASAAYEDWKKTPAGQAAMEQIGNVPFFMTSEVYGYSVNGGREFTYDGGTKVDYFDNGFDSMINFSLPHDAHGSYETLFSTYSNSLRRIQAAHPGASVLNYLDSHDDGGPFDALRQHPFEEANKLLLAPGQVQIYYGDETARVLKVEGAQGDANLRSFMNWDQLASNAKVGRGDAGGVADVRDYWARLGRFRHAHPAVGAGAHQMLAASPYTFKRTYEKGGVSDRVVVALDLPQNRAMPISVAGVFGDGQLVRDWFTGKTATVAGGKVQFDTPAPVALIAQD
ncbi:alpha-amylase family glycosyl hydrolase [Massilia sp. 9096]|uniref:alpha-amylase family glycosyl hydrolase n=1 Tax=Massilia sp. 9096 TaxID=1500894 RepID=UPI00056D920F|nr:alpha-amylase family glycosyl hydrolase [Massilia sp. 9096]